MKSLIFIHFLGKIVLVYNFFFLLFKLKNIFFKKSNFKEIDILKKHKITFFKIKNFLGPQVLKKIKVKFFACKK